MPGTYNYPGVYVKEIPSGVHAIAGVSTSVTAFAGWSPVGPINDARRIFNFSDYERLFGGLDGSSYMGYAVRQFFLNGGSEAWIVRLAKSNPAPTAAAIELKTKGGNPALAFTALNMGGDGNSIEVGVNYDTSLPESTFNLSMAYQAGAAAPAPEYFPNLSMNKNDPNYVVNAINGISRLVKVEDKSPADAAAAQGSFTTGPIDFTKFAVDGSHSQFRVQLDFRTIVPVTLTNAVNSANTLQAAVMAQLAGNAACAVVGGNQIQITSNTLGPISSVRILPGAASDISGRLMLNQAQGAKVVDAAGLCRPLLQPPHGSLAGGTLANADMKTLIEAANPNWLLNISLDNSAFFPARFEVKAAATPAALKDKLSLIAGQITTAVQKLRPSQAFSGFSCTVNAANNGLILTSGSTGKGSSVAVKVTADPDEIGAKLKLGPADSTPSPVLTNFSLTGGSAEPYDAASEFGAFIPLDNRSGIYALEEVPLFNLLCLPGISNSSILDEARAYCEKRRAFLIIDPPAGQTIDNIQSDILPNLPKTANAALYYPWIEIADPLNGGQPRAVPPSGTIAGVFARTDSNTGVWKAPAGIQATLTGVTSLRNNLTDAENGVLNVLGVNCLRNFTASGIVSWGARTLRGSDDLADEYKYVPVRRLALYIEESLYRGLRWVVFEPNDEPLWAQIRLNVGAFMSTLFRSGAFQGKTPREAYLVKCDSETTTQTDIDNGIVNILVGFAPLKPAEFVILMIQQLTGQISV